jgi:hypothetical protein
MKHAQKHGQAAAKDVGIFDWNNMFPVDCSPQHDVPGANVVELD